MKLLCWLFGHHMVPTDLPLGALTPQMKAEHCARCAWQVWY